MYTVTVVCAEPGRGRQTYNTVKYDMIQYNKIKKIYNVGGVRAGSGLNPQTKRYDTKRYIIIRYDIT